MSKKAFFILSLVTLFFLFAWELLISNHKELFLILPAPSKIFSTFIDRFDRLLFHTIGTVQEILFSFFLAISISLPLVFIMVRFSLIGKTIQMFFILFQSIPTFCLAPIMVLWFGWSMAAIVIPTAITILFPLTLGMYKGVQSVPDANLDYFRLHKATGVQTFLKLKLPYALPSFFAGLRISLAIGGLSTIAAELIGANRGLGVLMVEGRQSLDIEVTFAALFIVIMINLLFYGVGMLFEKNCWTIYRKISALFTKNLHLLAILLLFSSCGKSQDTPSKIEEVNIVLDWLPNPNHVGLFAGKQKGFFEEEGIDLKIHKALTTDPLQVLATKEADLVVSYLPRTLRAVSQGAKFHIVGKIIDVPLDCLLFLSDNPNLEATTTDCIGPQAIKNGNTLKVGVADSCYSVSLLETFFKHAGIKDFKKKTVNFDLTAALVMKNVDAIYGAYWNIETEQINSLGKATRYIPVTAFGIPTYAELVVVGRRESTTKEFTNSFKRALNKSMLFSKTHQEEAFKLYLKENPDKGEKTIVWEEKAWGITAPLLPNSQDFNESELSKLIKWLLENKIISTPIESKSTFSLLKE